MANFSKTPFNLGGQFSVKPNESWGGQINGTHSSKESVLWRWIESRLWNGKDNGRHGFITSTAIHNSRCSNIADSLRAFGWSWRCFLQTFAKHIKHSRSAKVLEQIKCELRLFRRFKQQCTRKSLQSWEYGLLHGKRIQWKGNHGSLCSNQLTRKAVA